MIRETTKEFLNLFYDPGEEICVSDNKFAHHSVSQEALGGEICLISPNKKVKNRVVKEPDLIFAAINPISGFKCDDNVTAFRAFLVEMDGMSLKDQKKYIENSGLPYSICVFSGNRSLHYGIILDRDLESMHLWRHAAQWMLNILEKADQQVKSPSVCIRFPGNKRKDGKKMIQSIVDMKKRVNYDDFYVWLNKHKDKKPKRTVKSKNLNGTVPVGMPKWVKNRLIEGIEIDRNSTWFNIACAMARAKYNYDQTVEELDKYFEEEPDFKRKEWIGCIKRGFKTVNGEI